LSVAVSSALFNEPDVEQAHRRTYPSDRHPPGVWFSLAISISSIALLMISGLSKAFCNKRLAGTRDRESACQPKGSSLTYRSRWQGG
jgi:hypothetical protein